MAFAISECLASYFTDTKIDLPRFQRKATWDDKDNFKLCISVFKGYPIGVIIVNETSSKRYLLDGRQRRNAILKMFNNPVEVYRWAKKFIGFKDQQPEEEVRARFFEKISEYLQSEFNKSTEDTPNEFEFDEPEWGNEGKTFDKETQNENMRALLGLILLVHNKFKNSNKFEGIYRFEKIIPIEELDYSVYRNGEYVIDPVRVKGFIKERIKNDETSREAFVGHLQKRYRLNRDALDKLDMYMDSHWEYFEKCFDVIRKTDEIIINARIGLIRLIDASPLDAQNIFSLVNGGGAPLTAEELLSARPFWNVDVSNPSDEIREVAKELYKFLGINVPSNIVRWDICATLLSRVDKNNLIFTRIEFSDPKITQSLFTKKLTMGFKLLSAVTVGGITSNSVKELENDQKNKGFDWSVDAERFIRDFNIAVSMLYDCDYFRYMMSWRQSIMSLMGNSVALEFATLIYKNWIALEKPIKGSPNLKKFQKDAIVLCDRLIYEYSTRLWAGSADSRLARDITVPNERFAVVDTDEWEKVIDVFATGSNSNVDKGIIYHYYCLKKMLPSYDGSGAGASYEIDHVYAKAQFANVTTLNPMLMESIGNKALLPKLDNIIKGDKSIKELCNHNWLYEEVKRVVGINESEVEKYSDIVNIQELIDKRIADYKKVFSVDRLTLLNGTHF